MVGSQLVGLVPLKALLDAAAFYCEQENLFLLEEEQRLRLVGRAGEGGAGRLGVLRESRAAALGTCSPGLGSCPCGLLLLLLCFFVCACKLRSHFSLGHCWGFLCDLKYIQSCETSVRGGAWARLDGGICPSSSPDQSRFGGVSLASMDYSPYGCCGPGSLEPAPAVAGFCYPVALASGWFCFEGIS